MLAAVEGGAPVQLSAAESAWIVGLGDVDKVDNRGWFAASRLRCFAPAPTACGSKEAR